MKNQRPLPTLKDYPLDEANPCRRLLDRWLADRPPLLQTNLPAALLVQLLWFSRLMANTGLLGLVFLPGEFTPFGPAAAEHPNLVDAALAQLSEAGLVLVSDDGTKGASATPNKRDRRFLIVELPWLTVKPGEEDCALTECGHCRFHTFLRDWLASLHTPTALDLTVVAFLQILWDSKQFEADGAGLAYEEDRFRHVSPHFSKDGHAELEALANEGIIKLTWGQSDADKAARFRIIELPWTASAVD